MLFWVLVFDLAHILLSLFVDDKRSPWTQDKNNTQRRAEMKTRTAIKAGRCSVVPYEPLRPNPVAVSPFVPLKPAPAANG